MLFRSRKSLGKMEFAVEQAIKLSLFNAVQLVGSRGNKDCPMSLLPPLYVVKHKNVVVVVI